MIITINEKEIKTMLIQGLIGMGVIHNTDAEIDMIAGRGVNGMTAEIKVEPAEVVVVVNTRESFSGNREHPAPQATAVEENPETKTEDKPLSDEEPIKSVQPSAPLFGKSDKT